MASAGLIAPQGESFAALHPKAAIVIEWTTFHELKQYTFAVMVRGLDKAIDLREAFLSIDEDLVEIYPFRWYPDKSKEVLNSARRFFKKFPHVKKQIQSELWKAGWEDRL